jgi:hypothetical protein
LFPLYDTKGNTVNKSKKRIAGIPASVPTRNFIDVFDTYVEGIAKVHGKDAATAYRQFREGEAVVMDRCGVDYPDAQQQQQDFLSLRIDTDV